MEYLEIISALPLLYILINCDINLIKVHIREFISRNIYLFTLTKEYNQEIKKSAEKLIQ